MIDVEALKQELRDLPSVTSELPGVGGKLKSIPEDFVVTEVLPYEACGEGEHVFAKIRRTGMATAEVSRKMSAVLGVKPGAISWGGLKDKYAVATQTFCFPMPLKAPLDEAAERLEGAPFEVLELKRHQNKLRIGHVRANRFRILLRGADNLAGAEAIAERIKATGVPNFYGEQRFGHDLFGIDQAAQFIERKEKRKKRNFFVSALQSGLFNCWLARRVRRGDWQTMLAGDIAKKTDTGGLFEVDDVDEANARFRANEIIYTGPMYGHKMMAATEEAGSYEEEVLKLVGMAPADFKPLKAPGTRRPGILRPEGLKVEEQGEGLMFEFTLPSGAYATVVLREFMKPTAKC